MPAEHLEPASAPLPSSVLEVSAEQQQDAKEDAGWFDKIEPWILVPRCKEHWFVLVAFWAAVITGQCSLAAFHCCLQGPCMGHCLQAHHAPTPQKQLSSTSPCRNLTTCFHTTTSKAPHTHVSLNLKPVLPSCCAGVVCFLVFGGCGTVGVGVCQGMACREHHPCFACTTAAFHISSNAA